MGCAGSSPVPAGPFYDRTIDCAMPDAWAGVSEDSKVDFVFTMLTSPHMVEAFSKARAKSPGSVSVVCCAVDGGVHGVLSEEEETRAFFYEPRREGPRRMVVTSYHSQPIPSGQPTPNAAELKASAHSTAFTVVRECEARISADKPSVQVRMLIHECEKPPRVPSTLWRLARRKIEQKIQGMIDDAMDAIEREFRVGTRLPAPIAIANASVLPVGKSELVVAQAIAYVPIVEAQVIEGVVMGFAID